MVATVDFDGNKVDGHPDYGRTSEVLMHIAIYERNPALKAVVHSHPPSITAFALAVILANHGVTVFSTKSLIDAFYKLEVIEAYAATLLNAAFFEAFDVTPTSS